VPRANAFWPAAAWHFPLYLCFVFALYERKNETQKNIKYHSAEGSIADCVSPHNNRSEPRQRRDYRWAIIAAAWRLVKHKGRLPQQPPFTRTYMCLPYAPKKSLFFGV
jgi:hypothetical protein